MMRERHDEPGNEGGPLLRAAPPGGIILSLVVPCYNEEEVLPETARRLAGTIRRLTGEGRLSERSHVLFVDDGSKDRTWDLIAACHREDPRLFQGVKLSRNRGHQNALLCGLLFAAPGVDAAISLDADLQDDIEVIDRMIEKYRAGYEIVYGVRSGRKTDSLFKKTTAQGFYRFLRFLGVDIVYNHADFRLMGKNALAALGEYGEVNLFLRGIIPMLGYKTDVVYYERKERLAGVSKYPLGKMLRFAWEGITSLSIKPIRMVAVLGLLIFTGSLGMIGYFIIQYLSGRTVSGWPSMICSLWGIGGLILLSIGVVGEYIGKIYLETKRRPRFIIEKILGDNHGE
jgi:glycosyltransferase involved in cell wall biosynthesis